MESTAEVGELLRVLSSSLSHVNWRVRPSTKRRLETDIMALCTKMRPVVMVDYGGKMPELKQHLCAFLKYCQKESSLFQHLRVMLIEDMIYILHDRSLAEHVESSLSFEKELQLVDLEQDPPTIVGQKEESLAVTHFISVLKLFSLHFPPNEGMVGDSSLANTASTDTEFLDLSNCLQDTKVSIPTLNGWLLGYPVIYLFSTDHIEGAIYNLSTKSLRIYRILVNRNSPTSSSQQEELMSFSVPYDLSMGGANEPWADAFLSYMRGKWERCRDLSLRTPALPAVMMLFNIVLDGSCLSLDKFGFGIEGEISIKLNRGRYNQSKSLGGKTTVEGKGKTTVEVFDSKDFIQASVCV